MIEVNSEIITAIMLGMLILGLMSGFPLAVVLGGVALIFGYAIFAERVADMLYLRMMSAILNYTFLACPLFIFMGIVLEASGIADKLYGAMYLWLGGSRGGLAIATILVGTVLATCVGIVAASVVMLNLVATPSMIKRGYSKSLATGAVCAGGSLGILIPPSIMLVVYGPMAGLSVGKLFMAAFFPGFLLSALYCIYIVIRSFLEPEIAPPVPPEERAVPFLKKTTILIASMVPPMILVLAVLGVIYFGIAAPTEAAAVGAFAATLLTVAYGKFSWKVIKETATSTMRIAGMIMLIVACAVAFVGAFVGAGGSEVIKNLVLAVPGEKWGAFGFIMLLVFIFGMFLDWLGIILIMIPIITPLVNALGFDPIWFAMMICVNLQTSFMTPPFAPAIYNCQGSLSPDLGVTMGDIIRGVTPFVVLVLVGLALCVAFPEIITWLPSKMIK